jgi:H+-translocating NAD(P) transhydrogenase subunit alpha
MNHSPKKTLHLLCGFALAAALLVTSGCGPSETAPEKATTPSATTAAAAPADSSKPGDVTIPADVATDKPSEAAKPADVALVETPKPAETPAVAKPAEVPAVVKPAEIAKVEITKPAEVVRQVDYSSLLFVFMLATFIGLGVILRVSRLLHTPLMSLTNAISAIAVVGAILVVGNENHPWGIQLIGAIALFASMTNIVSGFLITDRMLKMFKPSGEGGKR